MTDDKHAWWHQLSQSMRASGHCPTCFNPLRSALHHELCEVTSGDAALGARCGTYGGYQAHVKYDTPKCPPCRAAKAQRDRQDRAASKARTTEEAA